MYIFIPSAGCYYLNLQYGGQEICGNILRGWRSCRLPPPHLGNSGTATATSAVAVQHDC